MNGNQIKPINTFELFTEYWPFLLDGLKVLRATIGGNQPDLTSEEFFKMLLMMALEKERGVILLLESKNGKPLGYIAIHDITGYFAAKRVNVYAIYSNSKCASTLSELNIAGRKWGKTNGYKYVQAASFRFTGAAQRLFERKLGLKQRFIVYESEV